MMTRGRRIVVAVAVALGFIFVQRVLQHLGLSGGDVDPDRDPVQLFLRYFPVVVLVLVVGLVALNVRINRLAQAGLAAMSQGRYSEALVSFERIRRTWRRAGAGPLYAGQAKLALWRVAEAEADLELADRLLQRLPAARGLAPPLCAVAGALQGKTEQPRRWLGKVERSKGHPPVALLAEALLACRAGDHAAARTTLERSEVKQLGGFHAALANAAAGFCLERISGELKPVDKIVLFGETGPERLKALWPELADFVTRAPAA